MVVLSTIAAAPTALCASIGSSTVFPTSSPRISHLTPFLCLLSSPSPPPPPLFAISSFPAGRRALTRPEAILRPTSPFRVPADRPPPLPSPLTSSPPRCASAPAPRIRHSLPSPVSSLPLPVVGAPLRLGRRGLCCARRLDPTFGVGQAFARSSRATGSLLPPPRAASAAPAAATKPPTLSTDPINHPPRRLTPLKTSARTRTFHVRGTRWGIGACLFGEGRVPGKPYRHLLEPSFLRLKGSLSTTPISIRCGRLCVCVRGCSYRIFVIVIPLFY
eukprot:scaffold4750_cov140-Isochrysis_galbana.AAC.8